MTPATVEQATFLQNATIQQHNLSALNKTRIRFKIGLKNTTRKTAPKWQQILKANTAKTDGEEHTSSDLEKVTRSEVGLRGISCFKALDEATTQLRREIDSIKDWMTLDDGDYICTIELAPLVWQRLIEIRDVLAPSLRQELKQKYASGRAEFESRIEEFLSAQAWNLTDDEREVARTELITKFPNFEELEDYLQVIIGRPVIIPALSEQINQEQADCLNRITQFIAEYDSNLQASLEKAAIAGGQQLAVQLLEDLSQWEPGKKPARFRKRIEKHLQKIQVLIGNASPNSSSTLAQLMERIQKVLETASVDAKKLDSQGKGALQEKMNQIYQRLLGEQRKLIELAQEEGLDRSEWVIFNGNS